MIREVRGRFSDDGEPLVVMASPEAGRAADLREVLGTRGRKEVAVGARESAQGVRALRRDREESRSRRS